MLTRQIDINNFKRLAKEHYLFVVPRANYIVHGLVAAHSQSKTHNTPPLFSVELLLLATELETVP
jgi:predicted class III extradiol MEMO1 family dioxygenase